VTIHVAEGSLTAIIGPNGAGKTTLFNLMTGIYRPTSGTIMFNGRSLVGLRPDQVKRGRGRADIPEYPSVPRYDGA